MSAVNKKIIGKLVIPIVICFLTAMMLFYLIFSIQSCASYFEEETKAVALRYSLQDVDYISKNIDASLKDVSAVASGFSTLSGFENYDRAGEQYVDRYKMCCLQLLKDGEAEYRYGVSVGSSTSEQFASLISGKTLAASEIFVDRSINARCYAVYCPVEKNSDINGVIAYFPVLNIINANIKDNKFLKYYCFAEDDGTIIESYSDPDFITDVSHNAYTYIQNISDAKRPIKDLERDSKANINGAYSFTIESNTYVASSISVSGFKSGCFVMSVYSKNELLQNEYSLYDKLIGSATGILILSIIVLAAYLVIKFRHTATMEEFDDADQIAGCNSFAKFSRIANDILAVNRHSSYSVVYFNLKKFTYFKQNHDPEICMNLLSYVANVIKKTLSENETYGHVSDDCFVALMHNTNEEEFSDRIKITCALIAGCEIARKENFPLTMSIGAYNIDRTKSYTVRDMLDRAIIAEKLNKKTPNAPYTVYDSSIRAAYLKEGEIESKMESSLKNREFKVFFQPKYNIKKDRIDGAEALVRWYDPESKSYISPDSFIPLFEVNGFITKLDKYVFTTVCEYLSEATLRGEKIVPISVNVSRVTATDPDFLSYYIDFKKKCKIADGFLMIEFTESFAYENYETLQKIVSTLRKNGFKCSIDDFGSGYSSFNILKELQMDELKFDKLFLKQGTNPEKDEILLRTVLNLGIEFKMKVTQEGVENRDQINRLIEYGCDVIQGYYYSKPLPMSDYIDFVQNETSLRSVVDMHLSKKGQSKS